ncbi:MAG: pyridoxal-phosphate dependent enzyme, partial [Deltaproteobacteria bacterium]|nr:pyridoxal-phosphate dependent enzyme [Deltaproteobacteria bacterium]
MVSLDDIRKADQALHGRVLRTPLVHSASFSKQLGGEVFLKLENLQKTGSFKLRGAAYKIQRNLSRIGPRGVVAASAGNHAQGVALAAREAGIPGQVLLKGQGIAECIDEALALAETGMTFIHPYDDPETIAGQGTIALEIFNKLPDPDLILVPIGGGGLIGGIAAAAKALRPETRVIGVQAAACPSAYRSREMGQVVKVEAEKTIADGIAVKQPGELTFQIIQEKVDEILLVEEEEIGYAVLTLLEREKILAEGAGAVPVGALINPSTAIPKGSKVVLVISGGNVDMPLLNRILKKGLLRNGRMMKFAVNLEDTPGSLAELLTLIAKLQANVLKIDHRRNEEDLPIYVSRVELELETRGWEHL